MLLTAPPPRPLPSPSLPGGNIGGPAFRHFQEVEEVLPQFWEIVLVLIGAWELRRARIGWNDPGAVDQMKDDYNPGQVGFDPLGLFPDNNEEAYALQTKEINNGAEGLRFLL